MENLAMALKELGEKNGFDIALDDNGACTLELADGRAFCLQERANVNELDFVAILGEVPEDVRAYVFTELEDGTGAYIPINEKKTAVFVLVENVENDMVANRYPSLFDAQQAMFRRYVEIITGRQFKATKYAKMSFPACLPDLEDDPDMDDDETRGIREKDACIWDGPNHDNYSWRIFEL